MFQPTTRISPPMLTSTPTTPSAPIPIKQRYRSSFSQTRKRRPSESTPRLVHSEDRDRLASSKLQASVSPVLATTATFTTTPSGALALSLSPPGFNSGLSKSAPLENEVLSTLSHRRKGTIFKCETCSKVYRHPSCLVKHRWEHSPHWHEASKFLLSKHQQVQLLEAAAILSHLSPTTTGGTSLPEDRSLWPSYLSGGLLPLPVGHPNSDPHLLSMMSSPNFDAATQDSFYSFEPNSSTGATSARILSETAASLCGVKLEASPEVGLPAKSEDSTSEEEDGDVDIEDAEFEDEAKHDIQVDIDGEENVRQENKSQNGMVIVPPISTVSGTTSSSTNTSMVSTEISNSRPRTTTPGLSFISSKASTPKPLPTAGTATIPARAGLTEIRPGLLGHPNPPSSTIHTPFNTPTQILANVTDQAQSMGVSPQPSHWRYGYSHPHAGSNGYAIISQTSVPNPIPPIHQQTPLHLGPLSMSAPLSASPFSHLHLHDPTSYSSSSSSSSHHHYGFSPSYSPVGSISGPFSSLSLSYSSSALGDDKRTKGLGLPRSSVRSSSGSSDDEDESIKDNDMEESIAMDEKRVNDERYVSAGTPGSGGEWEMEI